MSVRYAFTFPVARWLAGSVVGCYVHYPTISTDMLDAVAARTPSFNNDASIASSPTRSCAARPCSPLALLARELPVALLPS